MLGAVVASSSLTARAVRFYEQLGLIQPRRDELNRRIFTAEERMRLQVIALLRNADLPFKDVTRVLQAIEGGRAKGLALALLRRRGVTLQRQLAALGSLEQTIAGLLGS